MRAANSHFSQLWRLAWPLILSNLCVPLAGLVDTALLGHLPSAQPLSAVAIAASLCMLVLSSFNFLRMASTGLSAQALSAPSNTRNNILLQGLFIALSLGLAVALLGSAISQLGLAVMAIKPPLLALAQQYSEIRLLAAPAVFMNFVFIGFMIGQQHSKAALLVIVTAVCTNILADVYLIYGLNLGSQGAAWASVAADYCGFLCALLLCRRQLCWPSASRLFTNFQAYLQVNSDLFIRSLCLLASFALFNALSENLGATTVAANAILLQMILLQSYLLDGFANATEAKVGQFYQQPAMLQRYLNSSFLLSFFAAGLLVLVFLTSYQFLPALFTNQPEIIAQASKNMVFIILMPLFAFPAYWLDGVAVGLAASKPMRNASVVASIFIFAPLSILFMLYFPNNSILWLCFAVFMVSRWLLLAFFLHRGAFTFLPRAVLSS